MLQRAASNAYSWWWASHIRTKQSKWMEQSLQDMEEKVQHVLTLLEEDGDSFAKRAEMYYKKRPELINFVEETFKAYRALAERYDHLSTELQNANNTIASVFPDRVPYMDEYYEDATPRTPRKLPEELKTNIPPPPPKDLKNIVLMATKQLYPKKKTTTTTGTPKARKSGLSRKEALEEVDKLQKQILELQTVKEFVKSSYDNAINRYWETEEQINELLEKVSILQDELGEGIVIEDGEARRLMAETALKSCQEALTQLQEKQEKSLDETRIESKRVKDAKAKLGSLMDQFQYDQSNSKEPRAKRDVKDVVETMDLDQSVVDILTQQRQELQLLQENIKQHFVVGSNSSLSVAEMAEKIDDLVNKVISLETSVSSQTALVKRLRTETGELHDLIRILEGDKESLIKEKKDLNDQLREMEEKMHRVQDLNQIVEDQNGNLQINFTEARCNIDHLSEKVQNVQLDEEVKVTNVPHMESNSSGQAESKYEPEGQNPLNQDNYSLIELEITGLVEDAVNSDKELKVAGTADDDITSDNMIKVTSSPENDVHTHNELNPTRTLENDVFFGTLENDVFFNTMENDVFFGTLENDIKSGTSFFEMEEATPEGNKSPEEFKALEGTLNPSNANEKATIVNITTENQKVSQHQVSSKEDSSSQFFGKLLDIDTEEISSETQNMVKVHPQEQGMAQDDDETDWRQMFTNGMDGREKALLTEYTNVLRNYKDVKKKLAEVETIIQDNSNSSLQLQELMTANSLKDEEIKILREKLHLLQKGLEGKEDLEHSTPMLPRSLEELIKSENPEYISQIEENFRASIDEILEENLAFWLKFSTTFGQIEKFETTIQDLQTEVSKLEERGKSVESSNGTEFSLKSEARPIYKHLKEIQTDISVWLEKSYLLKDELQNRFTSLCEIQEEITLALRTSAEDDDFKFTSYEAAKFQGEVLNMKQENNKVANELQTGLDAVTSLQNEVEKVLVKLNEKFGLSASKRQQSGQLKHSESKARVPLRSFIFGTKPKKQSLFSRITPVLHRKHRASKTKL